MTERWTPSGEGPVQVASRVKEWIWRWRWFLALNAFLLAPIVSYELRIGAGGPDKTLFFILPASLLWLMAVQLLVRRVLFAQLLLLPFYLTVAADLYVISAYETRLSSSMLLVIVDNWGDANEYARAHASRLASGALALALGYGYALYRVRQLRVSVHPALLGVVALLLVGLYVGVERQVGTPVHLAANDRSTPFGVVPQSYVAYSVHRDAKKDAQRARSFVFHAKRGSAPSEPETYVLVLGESARPDHFGVYGYARDTTPRLGRLSNLVVFRNVVSQCALTKVAVPLILTRGSVRDQERAARERSVISAFQEVGFGTYWLSTQQRDPFTGTINRYSSEAETQRFFERRHDGVLIQPFAEVLAEAPKKSLFVVVHLMGNHFVFESRYPGSFERFPVDDSLSARERMLNAYDNSVLYGDFVLGELIERLRKRPGKKALLYVADHGENLRDDARDLFGHFINNEYDLPVPMLFWYSEEFANSHPDKVAAARANANRPLTTRSVFYSLLQAADIRLDDPELDRLGVLSPKLENYPRFVHAEPKPVDYDATPSFSDQRPRIYLEDENSNAGF